MAAFTVTILFYAFVGHFSFVSSQVNYVIGVQDVMFPYANIGVSLPSNVNLVSVTLSNATDIPSLSTATQNLSTLRIDYLIYNYQLTASMATFNQFSTNSKVVPYLIIPIIDLDPILNNNAFYIDFEEKSASDAAFALLNFMNLTGLVYIDYSPSTTVNNLISFSTLTETLVSISSNATLPTSLINVFQANTQNVYICAIPLIQSSLIVNLLTQAMFAGQLNPGKVWIFIRPVQNMSLFSIFQPFSQVGGVIYGMSLNINSNITISDINQVDQALTRDFIRLIVQSINGTTAKPANASVTLLNTILPRGELINNGMFDPITHKLNGTVVNIMKVNTAQTPVQMFTYSDQLLEANASSIIRRLNYSGITVRIGVTFSNGYFMQNAQNGYYGFSVSFLKALQALSNFKYVFVFAPDNLTGEVPIVTTYNTTYTGVINLLTQNLADFSIIPMNPIYLGNSIFASDVVLSTKITMLSRVPEQTLFLTLIFVPFAYNVWLGIGLIILIMTFAFWSINKISPNHSKSCSKAKEESYSFGYSFLVIYSSFVTAKLKIKPKQASLHIFAFILWFSTLTFVITYASNMVAFMMSPAIAYPFKSASNLYVNSTFNWTFINNSIDISLAKNDPVFAGLYNTAITSWPNQAVVNDSNSSVVFSWNKFVLIQDDNKNGYMYNRICNADKFQGSSQQYSLIIPMNPNWPQRIEMKSLISQMINNGTITLLSNQYFTKGFCPQSTDGVAPNPAQLTLLTTISLFLIPLAGIVLGLLAVICHFMINKIQRCVKNSKMEKFEYGKRYEAKISSIDNDGVWAFINNRDRPYFVSSTSLHPDLKKKYTPKELGIHVNDVIDLKYFGKDPVNGYKRFCKDTEYDKEADVTP